MTEARGSRDSRTEKTTRRQRSTTAARPDTSPSAARARVNLTPQRDDLVDAGFLLVLLALAVVGFRTTYSGDGYLIAGIAGAVLGVVVAHLANVLRQPVIALAAMTLAVFFLAGGAVSLHSSPVGGVLPTGSTLHVLSDETVHGWKDLLTTLPPVDGTGPLLVLPYLLGLLGGVGGFALARRTRPSAAPVSAPFAVLVTVILLGTSSPPARLLQGALFGTVALAWITVRAMRRRATVSSGAGRASRLITVAALIAVSFAGAALLGPSVPGAGSHHRTVLRTYVQPPFDVGQYPSALAGFRKYVPPNKLHPTTLYDIPLFRVSGLAGVPLQIATMDDYDGLTWTAANSSPTGPSGYDTFQRVGTDIDDPVTAADRGASRSFSVTIEPAYVDHYSDMWLPTAGTLSRLQFGGAHAQQHSSFFRYNLATGTGVLPDRFQAGDTYTATTVLPAHPLLQPTDSVATDATPPAESAPLHSAAVDWSAGGKGPTGLIEALAAKLYAIGTYTNGEAPNQQFLPGHSIFRLTQFVSPLTVSGDDEQFAAAFALMIEQLGTPARVVLGAVPEASGLVLGKDVHAWVEVQLTDGSWRAIMTDTFMNRNSHPQTTPPPLPQSQTGNIVPPPSRGRPHSDLADANDVNAHSRSQQKHHTTVQHSAAGLPAWVVATARWGGPPIGALLLLVALMVGLKALRRRRRRSRGTPAVRLSYGWREITDLARDLGSAVPVGRTRREQARALAHHDVRDLAHAADAQVFGAADPGEADAHEFWRQVDATRKRMSRAVGRRRRWWAAVNPRSLRPPRATGEPA